MTVAELIKELRKYPKHAEAVVYHDARGHFHPVQNDDIREHEDGYFPSQQPKTEGPFVVVGVV